MRAIAELYFPVVGWWLLAGSVVFLGAVNQGFADKLLREWTYIFAKPYEPGIYGHVFIVWVSLLNIALGAFLVLAPGWDLAARQAMVIATNAGYVVFLALAIAGIFSPNYGPGIWVCVLLWATLLAWGVVAMLNPI